MAEVAGTPILQVGGAYALVIVGLIMLSVLSVFNPAVTLAIDRGQDPVIVLAIYGTFWSDLILLLAAVLLWGVKTFLYGIPVLQDVLKKFPDLLGSIIEALLSGGDPLASLNSLASWMNYTDKVTGFLVELITSFLLRFSNVIPPGQIPDLFERIVNWELKLN